jgi:single-stranded-DNA-specific exonuclease
MQKTWKILTAQTTRVEEVSRELNISGVCAQVLVNRGVASVAEARVFLSPRLSALTDPLEMESIKVAAARLLLAKSRNEKVLVFGDYDVDGVTGTALLVLALRFMGIDADYYIPHRYTEGYGMNKEAVRQIAGRGTKLIITVDCGVSDYEEINLAKKLGMEVIITDHHVIPPKLPEVVAVVNPKLLPEGHPSRFLAGVGVAFKFVWGVFKVAGIKDSAFLTSLLDLVGLGTISDIVPLRGENRVLAVHGLNALNKKKRVGIGALGEVAGIKDRISVHSVNYVIAPRLNAAGRLKHAEVALKLLLTEDWDEARSLARELQATNLDRRGIGNSIQEEVFDRLAAGVAAQDKLIFLEGKNWHPGVIGIVASQVTEQYFRPVVLVGIDDERARGSARSIEEVNVFKILESARDLYLDFGGHAGAAGFEIAVEKIGELKARLLSCANQMISEVVLQPSIKIEMELDPKTLTLSLVKELENLDPHGEENPRPIFITKRLKAADWGRVGANKKHLKARFTDGTSQLETIGFGMGERAGELSFAEDFDLVYNLQTNEWNGFEIVQLDLVDFRVSDK